MTAWFSTVCRHAGYLCATTEEAGGCRGLAVRAGFRFHVGAQDGVDTGLVAAAVFLQPLHDIVVNSDGEAVFGFGHGEPGGLPERFTELGDVGEVDVGIAHCAQPLKVRSSLCPSS